MKNITGGKNTHIYNIFELHKLDQYETIYLTI